MAVSVTAGIVNKVDACTEAVEKAMEYDDVLNKVPVEDHKEKPYG